MAGKKFYVVWKGLKPGVYDTWEACRMQVEGEENAKYKSFPTFDEAVKAYSEGHQAYLRKTPAHRKPASFLPKQSPTGGQGPERRSLAVDAACSGNPGDMEYRGVYTETSEELFHIGPFPQGTNNVGEFLALVHGLALLKQRNSALPVYSDSMNAIKWVKNKKCKTLLARSAANAKIFDLIERAEKWLKENTYTTTILKWETSEWGEIPADFGRK